ncbi:Na(+)-translocating NADH-quinone reductase subunit F [compost metagenome]
MDFHVRFVPMNKMIKVRRGTSVLRAAHEGRVTIKTRCGGNAGCLMCKIEVDPEHASALTPPTDAERRKLGSLLEQGIRLACQASVCGQAEVRLPEDPLKAAIRKQLEQSDNDDLW